MKKFKSFLLLLAVALVLPTTVLAAETEIKDYDELLSCVNTEGSTCKLTADIVLEAAVKIEKTVTLDLNGHKVTPKAGITPYNTGIIWVNHGGTLTINDSVGTGLIDGDYFYAPIGMSGLADTNNSKTAKLTVNGGTLTGYYYAISGNGSEGRDNTSITINGGTLESDYTAIYHPQKGTININGGSITGANTGIEMRAGNLTVSGGTIIGNGVPVETNPNGSGTTTTGAGIAISQHRTALETTATITGGTICGYSALYQTTVETTNDISKIALSVSGGMLNAINGGTVSVYSEDFTNFITGGTFSSNVSDYVKTGYEIKNNTNAYVVSKIVHEVSVPTVDLEAEVEEVVVGTKENEQLENVLIQSLDKSNLEVDTKTTVSLDINNLDETQIDEEIVKEIEKEVGNATIATYFDISVLVKDSSNNNVIGNLTELTEEIELMILLPEELKNVKEGMNRIYHVVRRHINEDNEAEIDLIEAKLSEDGNYLVFKTDKFSTYALAYEDVKAELPPQTGDGITTYLIIGFLSLIGLVGIGTFTKKRLFN